MNDLLAEPTFAENLARRFHDTYEMYAPRFNYETRRESAVPWEEVLPHCLHYVGEQLVITNHRNSGKSVQHNFLISDCHSYTLLLTTCGFSLFSKSSFELPETLYSCRQLLYLDKNRLFIFGCWVKKEGFSSPVELQYFEYAPDKLVGRIATHQFSPPYHFGQIKFSVLYHSNFFIYPAISPGVL